MSQLQAKPTPPAKTDDTAPPTSKKDPPPKTDPPTSPSAPCSRQAPPERPALRFSPTAWAKLLYFRDRGGTEIGGFGISAEGKPLLIQEFVTVKQEATRPPSTARTSPPASCSPNSRSGSGTCLSSPTSA